MGIIVAGRIDRIMAPEARAGGPDRAGPRRSSSRDRRHRTRPRDRRTSDALAYDDAFAELQRVVAALEAGGASLEATIALYERAVALQRRCERLLAEAELRVQQLMARADGSLDRGRPPEDVEEA